MKDSSSGSRGNDRRSFMRLGVGIGGAFMASGCPEQPGLEPASSTPLALTAADHEEVVQAMIVRTKQLGMFSVLDFPGVVNQDSQISTGIQAAIDEIAETTHGRGAILYFPPGEYHVQETLRLPRDRGLRIVGAGVFQTSIGISDDGSSSDPQLPLFELEDTGGHADFLSIEHIGLRNRSKGMVLRHAHTSSDHNAGRLMHLLMSRVHLVATPAHPDALLSFNHVHDSSFENITMDGGAGLYFKNSSRIQLRNVRSTMDGSLSNGIVVEGGGTFSLYDIRLEGIEGGAGEAFGHGLWLRGGVGDVTVRTIDFEGKRDRCLINIEHAHGVTLHQVGLATPLTVSNGPLQPAEYPQFGLRVGADSTRVRVEKGSFGHFARYASGPRLGSKCVLIEPGAREVELVDMLAPFYDPPDISAEFTIPDTIGPFRIAAAIPRTATEPLRKFAIVRGVVDTTQIGPRLDVQDYSLLRVAGGIIEGLDNGHTGQIVTLLFDGATDVESSEELVLATTQTWAAPAGASLRLMYDGTRWVEIARMADEGVFDVDSWTGTIDVGRGTMFRVGGDRVNVLAGGFDGKRVTLLLKKGIQFQTYIQGTSPAQRGNLTFQRADASGSWTGSLGDSITFVCSDGHWYEVGRSEQARPGSRTLSAFGVLRLAANTDRFHVQGDHFHTLEGGLDGDVITLLFDDDVQLVRGGNLRFAAPPGAAWVAPAGCTMRFLRDQGLWHELSRSLNA